MIKSTEFLRMFASVKGFYYKIITKLGWKLGYFTAFNY